LFAWETCGGIALGRGIWKWAPEQAEDRLRAKEFASREGADSPRPFAETQAGLALSR